MDLRTPVDVWVSCGEPFVFFKGNARKAWVSCKDYVFEVLSIILGFNFSILFNLAVDYERL